MIGTVPLQIIYKCHHSVAQHDIARLMRLYKVAIFDHLDFT